MKKSALSPQNETEIPLNFYKNKKISRDNAAVLPCSVLLPPLQKKPKSETEIIWRFNEQTRTIDTSCNGCGLAEIFQSWWGGIWIFCGSLKGSLWDVRKRGGISFIQIICLKKKETPRNEGLLNSAFRTHCSLTENEKKNIVFFTNKFEHWNRWLLWAGRSQPMKKIEKK